MHLFCFGLGYSALVLARRLLKEGVRVSGTVRDAEKAAQLNALGMEIFDLQHVRFDASITHVLLSIPPDEEGDLVFRLYRDVLENLPALSWVGYLSTTGVYGDSAGQWVDECTVISPKHDRGARRALAEAQWLSSALPIQIFRLAGIYGPGRSAIDDLRAGVAKRIDKPGHVFCRIHVEDIATILQASMRQPMRGEIYNCADDLPAAQAEVVEYAAQLLGVAPPPLVPFQDALLSAMARSFYVANRRISNRKIKKALSVVLSYPSYKEGLRAILNQRN